ncbi:hypothetical protein SAMN05421543_1038 [Alicyclobacillus macrosporangiidus]|uniref:Uncharacterized protein n=1 Tax=Alicyclobacillus macrosporangiidus TaxID=392015 RepID=A0A1I7GQU2_9BACL|nr:hypothetical protein SAMN05421543_1038 [Alicyclobacillus macrosporangiidus]
MERDVIRVRLGLNIEYEGKLYDILELPPEAFVGMVPGLTEEQFRRLDEAFRAVWPETTVRRHHILGFVAEQAGTSIDYLLLNREHIHFDELDISAYIEEHDQRRNRPS